MFRIRNTNKNYYYIFNKGHLQKIIRTQVLCIIWYSIYVYATNLTTSLCWRLRVRIACTECAMYVLLFFQNKSVTWIEDRDTISDANLYEPTVPDPPIILIRNVPNFHRSIFLFIPLLFFNPFFPLKKINFSSDHVFLSSD